MSEGLLDVASVSVHSHLFEESVSTVIKINKNITIQEEMVLFSNPPHAFSDRDLPDLYEITSKLPRMKQLCYPYAQNLNLSDCFQSMVGISPSSSDALLLVLIESMAKFRSMQEF